MPHEVARISFGQIDLAGEDVALKSSPSHELCDPGIAVGGLRVRLRGCTL
jgi:hypothetical protein